MCIYISICTSEVFGRKSHEGSCSLDLPQNGALEALSSASRACLRSVVGPAPVMQRGIALPGLKARFRTYRMVQRFV